MKRPVCASCHRAGLGGGLALLLIILGCATPPRQEGTTKPAGEPAGPISAFDLAVVGATPDSAAMAATATAVQQRFATHPLLAGVHAAAVNERTIRVTVPQRGHAEAELAAAVREMCRPRGTLDFRLLPPQSGEEHEHERDAHWRERLHAGHSEPQSGDEYAWFPIDDPVAFLDLADSAELAAFEPEQYVRAVVEPCDDTYYILACTDPKGCLLARTGGWRVVHAELDSRNQASAVSFELDEAGGQLLYDLTKANVGRTLCMFVDGRAVSAATIRSEVRHRVVIAGGFSTVKAAYLVQLLQSSFPPIPLTYVGPAVSAE